MPGYEAPEGPHLFFPTLRKKEKNGRMVKTSHEKIYEEKDLDFGYRVVLFCF